MEPNYIYAESTVKPQVLERDADTIYIRKNIDESSRKTEDGSSTVYWTYEEAAMSSEDFDRYIGTRMILAQNTSENNQLAIMEAFTDLYELIAGMLLGGD